MADPVRLAAIDRENDAVDLQDSALGLGRPPYARRDFGVVERELLRRTTGSLATAPST